MTTFKDYLLNTTNVNISYAVRITGLPYIWTDGKASWASVSPFTEKIGGLASRDFTFTQKSDPLKPLDTGNGVSFTLVDDGSDYLHYLFAPAYEGQVTRLTASVDADVASLTFNVVSSTGFAANDYIYCGRETAQIDSTTATTLVLDSRGLFNSLRGAHEMRDLGQGTLGPKVTTSPVVFKNRVLEVVARPVDILSGTADSASEWILWAGLVEEVSNETTSVEIKCETLTKLIDSNWPHSMPACTLRGYASQLYLNPQDWVLTWTTSDTAGAWDTGTGQIGTYDVSSVFTPITNTASGYFTYSYIVKALNDTIRNVIFTNDADRNLFSLSAEVTPTKTIVRYSWGATINLANSMRITLQGPLVEKLRSGSNLSDITLEKGARNRTLIVVSNTGAVITKDATTIQVFMDVPDRPFFVHTNLLATDKGYAKISDGNTFEVIGFTTVTAIDADIGHYELTGIERELGGTKAKKWVSRVDPDEDSTETDGSDVIRIVQLPMMTRYAADAPGYPLRISDCLLACLLSTDDPASAQNSFEVFGYGMGLSYNERYVDTEGIRTILDRSDLPQPAYFWLDVGKGKEALEELLKFCGCFLTTKRFIREGVAYYGISIETIDPAYSTIYSASVDDSFRKQGTKVTLNNNERLIINNVSMKPFVSYDKESSLVTHNANDSITDYGASETLSLKPTTIFNTAGSGYSYSFSDYNVSDIVSVHMQIVQLSGYRWLGAFAKGTYIVRLISTYSGLCVQVGDRVVLDLSNVRAPNGSLGITSIPAKCIRAVHRHEGANKGADLEFRATFDIINELAPCAEIVGQSGTTLTLAANAFCDTADSPPFSEEVLAEAVDADWFDPTSHSDTLEVFIWEEGDITNTATKTISARSGNTVTINSALSAGLQSAISGGDRVLMTFAPWGAALSALQKSYAYVASNTAPPLLGGADQAKEFA